MIQG
jgi:hypothetical protein